MGIYLGSNVTGTAWMAHYGGLLSNVVVGLLNLYGTSLVFLPDVILDRAVEPGSPHVPEGLHFDLFDVVDPANPERPEVIDNVSGFTNSMMFNTLDENVKSIPQYRQRLWDNFHIASGVVATQNDYNILFNSYGY